MAVKYSSFAAQYNAPIKINGTLPIDARTVVASLNDLYGSKSEQDNTWQYAYNGLIVAVESEQSVYMCIDDAHPYEASSWKKISAPDLDISGRMVTVILYDSKKYAKEDGKVVEGRWEPNPDAEPLPGGQDLEVDTTYLQLALNDFDYVYIKSADLIDLTDYYTKEQVNEKINILDSSVSDALDDIKTYIDTQDSVLDEKIDSLDSSLTLLKDYIDEQDASIKDYVDTETAKIDQRLDVVDVSITNITDRITEFVNTVEEHFDEIDSSLNNLTADLEGVHEALDAIEEHYDAAVERINTHLDNIDSSIEELKSVDTSLDTKIEEVSTRLAELEIGTVDSISTDTPQYLIIDTSKGDVSININASTSIDPVNFKNTALVTNGYVDEKLSWIEIEGN